MNGKFSRSERRPRPLNKSPRSRDSISHALNVRRTRPEREAKRRDTTLGIYKARYCSCRHQSSPKRQLEKRSQQDCTFVTFRARYLWERKVIATYCCCPPVMNNVRTLLARPSVKQALAHAARTLSSRRVSANQLLKN
jgi:IS30 family transposase